MKVDSVLIVASGEEMEPYYLFRVMKAPHILAEAAEDGRFPKGTEVMCKLMCAIRSRYVIYLLKYPWESWGKNLIGGV
jgi:hypothetical protein